MSGFDGRIIFEGDVEKCRQLLGVAIKRAAVQQQNKNILGLAGSTKTYDLGGGAWCVISDQQHMRAMRIVAPVFNEAKDVEFEVPTTTTGGAGVYDVISGWTNVPQIQTYQYTYAKGKQRTVDLLAKFYPTHRTADRWSEGDQRARLAVDENPIFTPPSPDGQFIRFSEHAHCKPTNYTGTMRKVAQLILGIGKIMRPTAEEKWATKNKAVPLPNVGTDILTNKPVGAVSAFGLYDNPEVAATWSPRLNFDYRAAKTHGVSFDSDGVPWLIEISMRGVHAMRLYLDPVSTTKEGRQRYCQVSPELEEWFKVMPGFPLGVTMPTFDTFEKFKRAGEVIELLDATTMRDFYTKTVMSSDTGWCFNDAGTEAHNTCWTWGLDEVKKGFHYSVNINLNRERFLPWTPKRAELAAKFSTVYEINKCRRMTEYDAGGILRAYELGQVNGYKAFDVLRVNPTLLGSATLRMHRFGYLYHPAAFAFQPQIKFPETALGYGGNYSFDFSAVRHAPYESVSNFYHKVRCDTPMYVYFVQNSLEVVSYAYDNTKDEPQYGVEFFDNRGECQYGGSWTSGIHYPGGLQLQGNFYSNRWDFRREQRTGASSIKTSWCNRIASWPRWKQDHPFSTGLTAWTEVAFYVDSVTKMSEAAPQLGISVALPMHDRSACYFGVLETIHNTYDYYSGGPEIVSARRADHWELFDFIFAWVGSIPCAPEDQEGGPLSCWARRRCTTTNEAACDDSYETAGFWATACGGNGIKGPEWNRPDLPSGYGYYVDTDPGQANCDIYFVNNTSLGETITKHEREKFETGTTMSSWWWKAAPDENGAVPTIQAVNSCLGDEVTNMMDDFDGGTKHLGGPEYMYGSWNACYTGVIE